MNTSRALSIAAILALALVGPAAADPAAAPPPAQPAAAETKPDTKSDTAQDREGLDDSWADRGGGGYRQGKRKATGWSYNYVQIAFAGVIMLIMTGFLVWLIRRKTSER